MTSAVKLFSPSNISIELNTAIRVKATSFKEKWGITSIDNDETAKKVVDFLTKHDFEFYTNGKALSKSTAENLVQGARERTEAGIPFSRFAITDSSNNVIGEWAIGFDSDPKKLQFAIRILKEFEDQNVDQKILNWCLTQYLPALNQKGIRFPVFAKHRGSLPWANKKVIAWIDLKEVSVTSLAHPDYEHGNGLLQKAGFSKVASTVHKSFSGIHDGRRNVYEISLKNFLPD